MQEKTFTKNKKMYQNLTFWVLTSIAIGILLGHFNPALAIQMKPLGTYFINVIKVFINPIIFLTITLGISQMSDLKRVGKVGGKALLYFEIVTTFALIIGIVIAYIIQPGKGVAVATGDTSKIVEYTTQAHTFSWLKFFKDNITIQVLIVAIFLGMIISKWSQKERVIAPLNMLSKYIFKGLKIVMYAAPIGAFGGMCFTIGKYGLHSLVPLAKLMITVYITMGIFVFLILGSILKYYKISIWKFLKYIKEELLIVLGTSSSESALPSLMTKLETIGCSKPIVGLVVPAGYSFNLDGTTIYLSMAVIFLSQVYNIHLTGTEMLTIIGILMVTSKGAAGVTGSGFIVLASTLTALGKIPVEGLTLLLGVDRFMSEARSITNFIGNGVATIVIACNEKDFDRQKMDLAFKSSD